jgi:cation diffusion facilitator CzcD-associated flavoprotein CzcO
MNQVELIAMKLTRANRRASQPLEQLDELMDCYLRWRDASRSAAESYRHWNLASRADCAGASSRYAAALDREEEAAERYRSAVQAIGPHGATRSGLSRLAGVPSLELS